MGNNFLNFILVLTPGILMGINQDPAQETIPPEFGANLSRVDGLTKEVLKARRISEVLYYFECPESVKRGFALDKNGSVSFREARFLGFVRQSWQHVNGEKVLVSERPVPSRESRIQAKSIYQKALDEIAKKNRVDEIVPVPFEFLGIELSIHSDVLPGYENDLEKVRQGYLDKPSDLRALIYLEIALIEQELGHGSQYQKLIQESVVNLNLSSIDYRADTQFRLHLWESLNFARPEPCLLFLAAENAHRDGKSEDAQKYFKILVERAPGSPFAWEALARLSIMSGVDQAEFGRLKQELLKTYPLIWGCPRPEMKLDKEEFKKHLDELLKKAGEEGTKDFRKSQQ